MLSHHMMLVLKQLSSGKCGLVVPNGMQESMQCISFRCLHTSRAGRRHSAEKSSLNQHSAGGGLLVTELWRYSLCVHVRSCRVPDAVKGEALYACVTLVEDVQPSAKLHAELVNWSRHRLAALQHQM